MKENMHFPCEKWHRTCLQNEAKIMSYVGVCHGSMCLDDMVPTHSIRMNHGKCNVEESYCGSIVAVEILFGQGGEWRLLVASD